MVFTSGRGRSAWSPVHALPTSFLPSFLDSRSKDEREKEVGFSRVGVGVIMCGSSFFRPFPMQMERLKKVCGCCIGMGRYWHGFSSRFCHAGSKSEKKAATVVSQTVHSIDRPLLIDF